ncbi:hypothetical protein RW1_014_01570 [Rhodococcus wratislaviensis NBRC 100605]|uniref:Transposase n=1 Tax=Rhodococcus wratislaviensis NBRC 100605 TaxID=1219028 RepID=X0PPL9_RHOWR|nr:hypothetical protein RW1_014_01570 [Rhodococcus wratislaviensis NBRC 100605]
MVSDALATLRRLRPQVSPGSVLVRADSAFYGHPTASAALCGGADVSVTVRMTAPVKAEIAPTPPGHLRPRAENPSGTTRHTGRAVTHAPTAH